MNKFKLYMLGLGLASMGLVSCTAGFLDVESKTESTTDNFYRTESDAWVVTMDGNVQVLVQDVHSILPQKLWLMNVLPAWEIQMPVIIRYSTVLMSISRLRI